MKTLLISLTAALLASQTIADIQDPPLNDYKPARKLGRGLANIMYSSAEIGTTMVRVNDLEGNSAAWSYGVVKGINRMMMRIGVGVYEVATYPFPTHRMSYRPVLKSNIPWVNNGYEEFPPEWGFQARKNYSTVSRSY